MPVAIEAHDFYSKTYTGFISEFSLRIAAVTADWRESSFLFQRLSVATQLFNVVCV